MIRIYIKEETPNLVTAVTGVTSGFMQNILSRVYVNMKSICVYARREKRKNSGYTGYKPYLSGIWGFWERLQGGYNWLQVIIKEKVYG